MKIYIRQIPGTLNNEIFFLHQPGTQEGDVGFYLTFGKDGNVTKHTILRNKGEAWNVKPAIILHELDTREMIQGFMDVGTERGFEVKTESFAKGKLEATEKHLEDMKKLVFKIK